MPNNLTPPRRCAAIAALVLAALAAVLAPVGAAAVSTEPITRIIRAQVEPQGAPGWQLYLFDAVIYPGATFPKHRHLGTQLVTVTAGKLHYRVFTVGVQVYRMTPDGNPLLNRTIKPGTTGILAVGDTAIEQHGAVHKVWNTGTVAVRLALSSLFPKGAPMSVPVG